MERALLEEMLEEGLSLEAIGRRVGRHEATVSYWLKKYELGAVNAHAHRSRGGLSREELSALVAEGLSTAQMSAALGVSRTTVRHWLREYGLRTIWADRRAAAREGRRALQLRCRRHGRTTFRLTGRGGYRCGRCMGEAVARRRRKVKQILVAEAGGCCLLCGYARCVAALAFHHVEPRSKSFSLSHRGVTRSLAEARAEAAKCVLLCANCHAEVEAGITAIPSPPAAAIE
jgi:transposase